MDCRTLRENLFAFDENALPAALHEQIADHARNCDACQKALSEFRAFTNLIDRDLKTETDPFAGTRILQQVENYIDSENVKPSFSFRRRLQPAYITLGFLVALVIGITLGRTGERKISEKIPTSSFSEAYRADLNIPDLLDETIISFSN